MAKTRRAGSATAVPGVPGASPCVLALRAELLGGGMRKIGGFAIDGSEITVALGHDSLWAIGRRGAAGLAVRAAYAPGGFKARRLRAKPGETLRVALTSAIGRHVVGFRVTADGLPVLRITTHLTPAANLLVPHLPRDIGGSTARLRARCSISRISRR